MIVRRTTALALVALLALSGAACSKKKSDDASNASPSSSSSSTTTTTASSNGSSSGDGSTNASDLEAARNAANAAGVPADCVNASIAFSALMLGPAQALGNASQADLDKMQSEADQLRSQIPEEIRADFDIYSKAIQEYVDALKGLDLTGAGAADPANLQKMQDAASKLEAPEVQQAQQHIEDYFKKTCPN